MDCNLLKTNLEKWDSPMGPFQTLESIEEEMKVFSSNANTNSFISVIDCLVGMCKENKSKIDICIDFMYQGYLTKKYELAEAIKLRSEKYREDHFFLSMLGIIPEGHYVLHQLVVKDVSSKPKDLKMDYLGVISRLARPEYCSIIQQLLLGETDPELLSEVEITLKRCSCV